jgi:hypothetical protein
MASDVSVNTSAFKAYSVAMKKAPSVLKRETIVGVNRVTTAGEAAQKRGVKTDTHNLQRSITMAPARDVGGAIRGVWGTNVPYARPENDGRSAGSAMPPAGVLLGWMARHGIDERFEFVIRRAIGQRGIVGSRAREKSVAEVKPMLARELRAAVKRTMATIR